MKHSNVCGFGAATMRAVSGASIAIVLMLGLSVFAGAQNVPQNTTGKNPGTQVPPGETNPEQTTAASQTSPDKKMQLGLGGVTADSFKFGEYNGLQNSGVFGIINFDFGGGAAYDSKSAWRWRFQGSNLGLEDRNVSAEFGKQGKYEFKLVYDEIIANRSDTFQTPYLGSGTNSLTLPANWLKPVVPQANATSLNLRSLDPIAGTGSVYNKYGVLTPPTAAQLAQLGAIVAADVPDFQNVNLATKRTRGDLLFTYSPRESVDIPVSYSREHKGGRKALGVVTSQVNENAILMPYLVDWDTSQVTAAVNYKLKKLFVSLGYYGSFFHNNTTSMTWQDIADPTKSATLGVEPSNHFNQFNATAAYKFSPAVKLVAAGSYGRSTQDQAFLGPSTAQNGQLAFGLPRNSLGGVVANSMFSTKLTAKKGKQWDFVAAYKLEDRDNQTPVSTYLFQDANESRSTTLSPFANLSGLPATLGSNTNVYANRAYSRLSQRVDGQAEFAFSKSQYLEAAYNWQRISRSCHGSWISCSDVATSNENTISADWRKAKGVFTGRFDYAFSSRRGNYNENAFLALVPMANVTPAGGATQSVYSYMQNTGLTAFGPVAGLPSTPNTGDAAIYSANNNIISNTYYASRNNINEFPGFRRYFVADLNRNHVRAEMQWQPDEKFTLHTSGVYNNDDYVNSKYGLKKGTFWTGTADASYVLATDFVMDVFYTYDNQRYASAGDAYGSNSTAAFVGQAANTTVSGGCFPTVSTKNASAKIDPCLIWTKNNRDVIHTVGFTMRRDNLMAKKLQLAAEFLYTNAQTSLGVGGGSYVNNPLALAAPAPALSAGTAATFYIPASSYPVISNEQFSIRPNATYTITKSASLQGFYWFQKLTSSDWGYQGLQYGTGTNYLPTNERAPSYTVNVAGLSLNWTF